MENNLDKLVKENANLKEAIFGTSGVLSGLEIIKNCLSVAKEAKHEYAPFHLDKTQAKLWHRAQAEAYQHALEIICVSSDVLNYSREHPQVVG